MENVPPGEYFLRTYLLEKEALTGVAEEPVVVSETQKLQYDSRTRVTLIPTGGTMVQAKVRFEDASGEKLSPEILEEVKLVADSIDFARPGSGAYFEKFSPEGRATASIFLSGVYTLRAHLPSGLHAKLLYNGNVIRDPEYFQFDQSALSHTLEIELSAKSATIKGFAEGLKEARRAWLLKKSSLDPTFEYFERITQITDGEFTFDGLPADDYLLLVVSPHMLETRNQPGVLEQLAARALAVHLEPGQTASVAIDGNR